MCASMALARSLDRALPPPACFATWRRRAPRAPCASAPRACAASADVPTLKLRLLRAAAASDRGQLHNAFIWGAGAYAAERDAVAATVAELEATQKGFAPPPAAVLDGDWELVYSNGQLFRSSPFFLAVSEAFADTAKSELFFRLHELQVASFGLSRYGRVEQRIDSASGVLTSSFTTLLFGLTVIPLIGWGKLLPTFGGRVVSFARLLPTADPRDLQMELEKTRVEQAPGVALMPLIGRFLIGNDAPVGAVWRLLPWNKGRPPACAMRCTFVDENLRIMSDRDGAFFVYVRC